MSLPPPLGATVPVAVASEPEAGGDWVLPLRDAALTARAALMTGASALSLVLLGVLATLGVILLVAEPGSLVPWAPLPLLPLAACCVAAWRWQPLPVIGCVAVAAVMAASLAALTVASAESPALAGAGTAGFTLSMTTNLAVVVGATGDRWTGGVAGALVGYALGEGTIAVTALAIGFPYRLDVPPIAIALGVALGYSVVPLARRRARRGTAALQDADRRARSRRVREIEGRESIALLHDTLLGELAVLAIRPPGPLDDAERAGILASLESSAVLPLLHAEPEAHDGVAAWLVSIGAAGGVRVRLEGQLAALDAVREPAYSALRAALEQCLVNVVRHAGVTEAWLAAAASAGELSVTVVDEGVGFDPDAVPHDRLGLSESVRGRLERCGGTVRVWSSPGAGTSVLLTVPMAVP
jgi:signal transduction histidine kinase